jgi:predicted O-methyltransferase YrrM
MSAMDTLRRLLGRRPRAPEPLPRTDAPGWPAGHFYSPLPDLADIRRREAAIFGVSTGMVPGVAIEPDRLLRMLDSLGAWCGELPFSEEKTAGLRYYYDNPNFRHGEAAVLYGMMRHLEPRRIIEVGSGFSSAVMLDTNDRCFGGRIALTFIEPFPDQLRRLLAEGDRVNLLEEKVYDVPLEQFTRLEAGDILFVDSSHVSKVGSDVNDIFFRILPALRPGVMIHFHDILHDFEYPAEWVYQGRAWNEAYLLRAFLQFNRSFTVEFFNSYLWQFHRERLVQRIPVVSQSPGSSIWIRAGGPEA